MSRRVESLRRLLPSAALMIPALALLTLTHATALGSTPAFLDDEGTYAAQAWSVLVQHRLSPYTYWYDHPPLGWVQLAGWFGLTDAVHRGTPIVTSARVFALVCAVVSGVLLYALGRRAGLVRWAAVVPVLALAASPLAVDYQRLAYLDNFAMPWLLGAFVLVLSSRRRLGAATGAGFCFAVACLTKETMVLFAPALGVAAWLHADRRTRSFTTAAVASISLLVLAFYPLFALLRGELLPGRGHVSLTQALTFQTWSRPSTGSPFAAHSLSRHLVDGWLSLDSWLLVAGVVAAVICLLPRRLRFVSVALGVPVLVTLRGGYLPQPFVIALLPFAALAIGGAVDLLWRAQLPKRLRSTGRWRWLGPAVAVLATVGAGAAVAPSWAATDRALVRQRPNAPVEQAVMWMGAHVPHRDRIIVDDSVWVDLVRQGFNPHLGVVWMYKLNYQTNLDPSVQRALPDGWRDCQYVLATPVLRGSVTSTPGGMQPLAAALAHSRVVASFGSGPDRVDVRRVVSGL